MYIHTLFKVRVDVIEVTQLRSNLIATKTSSIISIYILRIIMLLKNDPLPYIPDQLPWHYTRWKRSLKRGHQSN